VCLIQSPAFRAKVFQRRHRPSARPSTREKTKVEVAP
jgi:galactofuranose transport system permease protein